ncbi:Lysosomal Pro-X carboxypeptidase [Dirofilaria immitis]|nr:Lysosomal Pro-X carboxypeptidase [Dirofilaria immitis]
MLNKLSVVIIILFIVNGNSLRSHNPVISITLQQQQQQQINKENEKNYKWSEEWLENLFNKYQTLCFQWTNFFYTGNEGNIELFAQNTGLMWDLAPEFNAAVVFAEHRFYGKSYPFGKQSYRTIQNLGYLSSEQALGDFALLIRHLKNKRLLIAQNSSIIAFGGSYGGMLAAWIRIKYPHLVEGSIASSAPVFWFTDMSMYVPEDAYNHIVKRSFVNSGCIEENILNGWTALKNLSSTPSGRAYLNHLFHLDRKSYINVSTDWIMLREYLENIFESMAMVNYPYPTNYLAELPGWPVKVACQFFAITDKRTDEEYAESMEKETFCIKPEVCKDSAYGALGDPLG